MTARVSQFGKEWGVLSGDRLVGVYRSNREAWRVADEINGEHTSRTEEVSDWSFQSNSQRG